MYLFIIKLFWFLCLLLSFSLFSSSSKADHGEHKLERSTLELYDQQRQRPVKLTIWHPKGENCKEVKVCLGEKVRTDQVIVLSHGAMGAALNYNWLGYAFASQGFISIGINHYGESWIYGKEHIKPKAVMDFGQRPLDISFALDTLSQANKHYFSKPLNWNNISAVGHSSGAATMLSLAGAEMDFAKAQGYCQQADTKKDLSCAYFAKLPGNINWPKAKSFKDSRVQRLIALDPALGHVATEASLNSINTPTLIIGSQQNDFLLYQYHAAYYAKQLPKAQLLSLNRGEGHFVYLDSCNHSHQAFGVALCQDRQGVNRKQSQRELYPHIFKFLMSR